MQELTKSRLVWPKSALMLYLTAHHKGDSRAQNHHDTFYKY